MKKAEDFRKAFGPVTPGFESAARKTIRELRAKETQKKRRTAGDWLRWRRPVLAMAMVLVLFIGFLAVNDTLNLSGHTDQIRTGKDQYTVQPIETALSMGAGQEEGDGDGAENAAADDEANAAADDEANAAADAYAWPNIREDYFESILGEFFGDWMQGNANEMVYALSLPYRINGEASKARLKELVESGTPLRYQINGIRQEGDEKVYTCTVELDSGNGKGSRCEQFEVRINTDMDNDREGIDLNSFDNGQPAEMDPALENFFLSRETYIKNALDICLDGISGDLQPIGLSCERNGIRMELISGLLKDGEEYIFYSLEDLEGKYDIGSLNVTDLSDSVGKWETYSSWPVYHDRTARKAYFIWNPHYRDQPVDLADRTVTLRLDRLDILQTGWANVAELVEQYGGTTEGIPAPEEAYERDARKRDRVKPAGARVLDYHNPLDIQVLPKLTITGIGWIDDRLHVQVAIKNMLYSSFQFSLTQSSELSWYDGDNDIHYEETIFDIKPGDENISHLYFGSSIGQEKIYGPWTFNFPLSAICPETEPEGSAETADAAVQEMAAADTPVPNTNERLNEEWPGISEKLLPVHMAYEKQGLRVEVVSGYLSGMECYYVVSVQDTEGKYTDYTAQPTFTGNFLLDNSGYTIYTLYTDDTEHKTYYLVTPTLPSPVAAEDRIITAGVDSFWLDQMESFDLVPLLRQYGKTVVGVEAPDAILSRPGVEKPPRKLKYLDYTQPMDIPLFGDVCLSGIGWIDGQLHVQFHNTGRSFYQRGNTVYSNLWNTEVFCSADNPDYSPIAFDTDYDDSAEFTEYIFNVGPDETDDMLLAVGVQVMAGILDDGWMVEFPLSLVCPDMPERKPEVTETLGRFMNAWSVMDYGGMLALCDPSWQAGGEDPKQALADLTMNTTLREYSFETVSGTAEDPVRSVTCQAMLQRTGVMPDNLFKLSVEASRQEDGNWYINPASLEIRTVAEDISAEPVEKLIEDYKSIGLTEREGKLAFDVRAGTMVYTQDEIGYALKADGTAEAMPTSSYPGHREGFIIPEKVNGCAVTAIGEEAFWGFDMKSITLPDTVKSIGGHAFRSCDKLENIRIPEGVTSIEDAVFLDCIRLNDVVIPSSVTAIGKRAFSGCLSLAEIRIPAAAVSIGDYAFVGCTGLTSITLPESLNTLGCYALYRCTGLETVEVPGGVSLVGNGAFKNCTGLKTARLQEGVTFLGADAFTGCGALETIELPESLRSIGDRAFTGCAGLKKLVLPEGLESIGRAAFMNCAGLETLEIPESVTSIGENVFKNCENLTCTVTAGSYAMRYCVNNGITCIVK